MSVEFTFSKENLDLYLKELGKEFRKLSGKNAHAEMILIGGASIILNYDFRSMTNDADAVIYTDATMKDAINRVRDKYGLPDGWLNEDFKNTSSYTYKLRGISVPYKTFSNILHVRMITAEYLIAMKTMSGRQYKYDLSDIAGILYEHEKRGNPISRNNINKAISELYGDNQIPKIARQYLDDLFRSDKRYDEIYTETRNNEKEAKSILLEVHKNQPGEVNKNNINEVILEAINKKRNTPPEK